ncbi:MAG: hypothetical protein WHS87_00180 [Anaerolineales bacterium]
MNAEQRKVLQLVEAGRLSAEEAQRLLDLLAQAASAEADAAAGAESPGSLPAPPAAELRPAPWPKRRWWLLPALGFVLLIPGLFWLSLSSAQGWGLICGGGLIGLALGLAGLGLWMRNALWVAIEISDGPHLAFPLPLGFLKIGLKLAKRWIPEWKGVSMVELEMLDALRALKDVPMIVDVDEEDEHVRVYIG